MIEHLAHRIGPEVAACGVPQDLRGRAGTRFEGDRRVEEALSDVRGGAHGSIPFVLKHARRSASPRNTQFDTRFALQSSRRAASRGV
jgi:hypothetical protein